MRRTTEDIIEIGKDLLAVKASLPHGSFLPWLDAEFGMSESAAYRFMDVGKVYGSKLPNVGSLSPSVLYELAAPKTPIEVREEVEKMIEAGEVAAGGLPANMPPATAPRAQRPNSDARSVVKIAPHCVFAMITGPPMTA